MAAGAVAGGEIVVLPTDTVYGVGADAFNPEAVARLLAAKGRGREVPPPVLVASASMMAALAQPMPDWVDALTARFWPGGLTLVARAQPSLMWDLGETNGTVALRIPDHPVALELLAATGPLAVTSANLHGEPPGATARATREQLGESVSVYLEAGELPGGTPSTIVDATGTAPRVLREGAIGVSELAQLVPEFDAAP